MQPGKGVIRFDGKNWTTITEADGLPKNTVSSIFQDRQGAIWFGTGGQIGPGNGVGRFDGENWITYTTADGLANNTVLSIFQDRKGDMWFGTYGGGVSRFDGKDWTSYTIADGHGSHWHGSHYIGAILQDTEGVMWFGTLDGGVSRFDGRTFQTVDSRDGLPNDNVTSVYMDSSGAVWIGTLGGGAIRFSRPKKVQLPLTITKVTADDQVYEAPTDFLALPAGVKRVVFGFNAISFNTRPAGMRYYHRLIGREVDWQPPINTEEIQYFNLLPGDYAFEVQAVDRDLNYSIPTTLNFTVLTPFHKTALFLVPTVGGSAILLGILVMQTILLFKRRRQVVVYQRIAVEEIKAAREMQLSLLPETAPHIEGFEIAAVCEPATEVGGDYFTYLWLDEDKTHLGIVLMDVTGHGMAAATKAFLASGMLQLESRRGSSPSEILAKMHQSLQEILPKRAFVATSFAQINLRDYKLTYFNAGLPEPILLRKGKPLELQIRSTVPLGCSFRAEHIGTPIQLQKGDVLLLFSDGLTEARNASEDEYERIRMWNLLKTLVVQRKLSQEWVDAILSDVRTFTAPKELADDMTVVVVKIL
jgi:serine phosphatase RsbU (regulator of sigma subunit)